MSGRGNGRWRVGRAFGILGPVTCAVAVQRACVTNVVIAVNAYSRLSGHGLCWSPTSNGHDQRTGVCNTTGHDTAPCPLLHPLTLLPDPCP